MAHLVVTLAVDPRGILVTWLLDDVALNAGELLGQLPFSIAGAPTFQPEDKIMAATDDLGPVELVTSLTDGDEANICAVGAWGARRPARSRFRIWRSPPRKNHDPQLHRLNFAAKAVASREP